MADTNQDSVHEIGEILRYHEALFSSIKQKNYLKSAMKLSDDDAQLLEVKVIRRSLEITRNHDMPQASLKSAICLSKLAEACSSKGINIEGAAKYDLANVLWDQGEMTTSIRMLQQLSGQKHLHRQAVPISRAELLVTLVSCPIMFLASKANVLYRVTMLPKPVWKCQRSSLKSIWTLR